MADESDVRNLAQKKSLIVYSGILTGCMVEVEEGSYL
jgi:hypothetical protein